jgi:hypothetical protein
MGQQIAVSFEDERIKVVYGSMRKGMVTVRRTITFKEDELDHWLAAEKARQFIVVCQFKAFFSDTVMLPPAKDKFLATMVEAEIRKRFPESRDFSYFFTVLGTKESGLKPVKEIFFYAVDNAVLRGIVERFDRFHKTVTLLCPDVLALSHMVQASDQATGKTTLCMTTTEGGRTLFLLKGGELRFIRAVQSLGPDIHEMDVDNINMTISFCRQSLRVDPHQLVLVNAPEGTCQLPPSTIIPSMPLAYPNTICCTGGSICEYISPISALLAAPKLMGSNLLPRTIRTAYRQRSLLAAGTAMFVLATLLGIGYLALNLRELTFAREKLQSVRRETPGIEAILADYQDRAASLQQLTSYVAAVNEIRSAPDIQQALAELKFFPMDGVTIKSVQIKSDKDSLEIHLAGTVAARSFADMRGNYQKLLDNLKKTATMSMLSENLNLKDGSFTLAVQYSKG